MTSNPRNRDLVRASAGATQPATLPALATVRTDNPALDQFLAAVRERLEVREGARGNPWERAVTMRDLQGMGLIVNGGRFGSGAAPGIPVLQGNGTYVQRSFDEFLQALMKTLAWKNLMKRLDDMTRFDRMPAAIRDMLLQDIAKVAAERGADIQYVEKKIQSLTESLAFTKKEITAAVEGAYAGFREVEYAYATANHATAGLVIQVQARLDDFNAGGATVEEVMTATADRTAGLAAEYYVKLQAGDKVSGFSLAASEDPTGVSESAFIILADRFAVVTSADTIPDPLNPPANRVPFGVDASGIYVNGEMRVNATGPTLADLAATTGVIVSYTSEFWKVDSAGSAINTSITLTANLTAGLTGFVTWTKSGTSTAAPTAGTTNTWTINAADQVDDAITYTATIVDSGITYEDAVTIVRLRDGADALTGLLTNETHTVPASAAGVVSSFSGAGGTFAVYQGLTDVTTSCTFAIQSNPDGVTASIGAATGIYSATAAGSWADADNSAVITFRATFGSTTIDKTFTITKALTGAVGTDAQTLTLQATGFAMVFDDPLDIGSVSPTISFNAILQNVSGTATFVATAYNAAAVVLGTLTLGGAGNTRTLTAAQFNSLGALTTAYVKVVATLGSLSDTVTVYRGDGGSDAITLVLSNEAHTVPADYLGAVTSFTGAATGVKVYEGLTDVTSAWAITKADSGVTSTLTGSGTATVTDTVTAMSATAGTVTITATRTGYPTQSKVFSISKSLAGNRGSLEGSGFQYGIRPSAWSSNKANRVIENMLTAAVLTTDLATTTDNRIGDFVSLGNAGSWTETQGAYAAGTAYTPGQIVIYNSGAYKCTTATTGNAPTNTSYWRLYRSAVNSRGAWVTATAYAIDDTVTADDSSGTTRTYIAIFDHTSGATFPADRYSDRSPWVLTRGTYSAGTAYVTGDIAISGTTAYIALQATTGNAPPNATYWATYRTSLNSRGAWALSTAYAAKDTVTAADASGASKTWIALYAHTSSAAFSTDRDIQAFVQRRYWTGTAWLTPGVFIDGNLLVSGTVTADTLNVSNGVNLIGSNGAVGAIKLDSANNLVIQGTAANKSIKLVGPNSGGLHIDDYTTANATAISIYAPDGTQGAVLSAASASVGLSSTGGRNLVLTSASGLGSLTISASSFSFLFSKLSIKDHVTPEENAKYKYSTDGIAWNNIYLKRSEW